jgi:hypothetical protein
MSFFDDASLVMIPSGYKDQKVYSVKPTDGTGDLTFSRASSATRVASNGLIEKVRTNLILQSNTFSNASWTKVNGTVTGGQAGYDGSTNAWSYTEGTFVASLPELSQSFTASSNLESYNFYAKAGTRNWIIVSIGGAGYIFINLTNGTIGGSAGGSAPTATTQSVGNGWYRVNVVSEAGILYLKTGITIHITDANNSVAYNGNGTGNVFIQNLQRETGDIATDYIPTTTAAVSVGPVSGLPRLDYLGSTCPRLILEPQRTNVALNSETFGASTGTTIVLNNTASPDGYVSADKLVEDTSTGVHISGTGGALGGSVDSSVYSVSVFAKASGRTRLNMFDNNQATAGTTNFDIANGVVISGTGKIENYGNGWYRCSIFPAKTNSTTSNVQIRLIDSGTNVSYTGNGTSGVFLWGAQIEAGAYATSYIPTLGASVTRVADAASKTGISSLIGQTEGTIFWEGSITGIPVDQTIFGVEKESSNFVIRFGGDGTNIYAQSYNGATSLFFQTTTPSVGQTIKLAFAYKAGSYAFYKNGTLVAAGTNATTIPACDKLQTNVLWSTSGGIGAYNTNQTLLFKTRLTNAQLAELTA